MIAMAFGYFTQRKGSCNALPKHITNKLAKLAIRPEEGDDANDNAPSLQGEAEEKPVNCRQRWAHDDVLEGGASN